MTKSKGAESQLILVMDNFHCACYWWSSEPKGKEKNDFDNIVMGYWYFLMNEDYDSMSLLNSSNKVQGWEGGGWLMGMFCGKN